MLQRTIPSTNESLPVIGLGTWQTFDVGKEHYERLSQVLTVMHASGGRVVDSSPMYGNSERVIGDLIQERQDKEDFFYATKVWIEGKQAGIQQMQSSMRKMQRSVMDLIQIHNLVDWKKHLKTLREWKEKGLVRYIGITHYIDSMHETLEKVIRSEPVDFIQFNYSITERKAEQRLLPAAQEMRVATLINRPLGEGKLFQYVKNKPLPEWAKEYSICNWVQYFLKFLLAQEGVTCIIPGTGDPEHMKENMLAGSAPVPDPSFQSKMGAYIRSI